MSIDLHLGGGTAERVCQLTKALNQLPNTEAKVLSTTSGLKDGLPLDQSQCMLIPCLNDRWYIPAPFFMKIYRAIQWSDVLVITGHWTLLNAMVYVVNKLLGRPYLFNPAGALHIFGRSGVFKRIYQAVIGQRVVNHAAYMIAIPAGEKEFFCTLGVGKDRIEIIPNGITLDDFMSCDEEAFRRKYRLSASPFVLFMGRLNAIKGPDILLQAFFQLVESFPDVHLVMAGPDGGMQAQLEYVVRQKGLADKIHFIGYVSGKEKSDAYHAADMLIVPSRLEAMSIVALEAAVCGTPVVMTNICGFPELAEAGGAIEVGIDVIELRDAMSLLLHNQARRHLMGAKGKALICREYTWNAAAIKHRKICDKVV